MTDEPAPDLRVVQCNFTETTNVAAAGARAYVMGTNDGNGNDRIPIMVRSHGARWVEKWESAARLTDLRLKTIPPEHPLYGRFWNAPTGEWAAAIVAGWEARHDEGWWHTVASVTQQVPVAPTSVDTP